MALDHSPRIKRTQRPSARSDGDHAAEVVRLSVNLAGDVADEMKRLCKESHISLTEGVRRAIVLWKLVDDERKKGNRIMIVGDDGDVSRGREIILL